MIRLIVFLSLIFSVTSSIAQHTTLILPVAPGGLVHQYVLGIKDFFNDHFKNNVVIDLKPGAYGSIGAAALAENKTEKISLLMGPVQNWPTHPLRDMTPVAFMGAIPGVIFVNANDKITRIDQIIELSKSSSVTYAFPGASNNGKLIDRIAKKYGRYDNFVAIPYKSGVAVTNDILGKHVKLGVSIPNNILQHVQSGAITPLAIFGPARSTYLPNVPTLKELSILIEKEYVLHNNIFLFVNKTADPSEVQKLKTAIKKYLESDASLEARRKMDISFGSYPILAPDKLINDIISE